MGPIRIASEALPPEKGFPMLFYVAGSILFMFALALAIGVIAINGARYRHQALAALRTLSLDGAYGAGIDQPAWGEPALRARSCRPLPRPALQPAA